MKLLLSSVGSLVGQEILDVLEAPGQSRRHLVTVVGTNSVAAAPSNFRCNRCYLVPQTATSAFEPRMREILTAESPDLILCGRDEDTLAISRLKADDPALPGVLPVGEPHAALIGLDKWQTCLFTRKHGLPFAETFLPGVSGDDAALDDFCRTYGYPLVAKPVRGFASRGVHFVRNAKEVREVTERGTHLLQEYLGDPLRLQAYFDLVGGPPPLFAQAPDTGHYSCMTVIGPRGEVGPILSCEFHNDWGMATRITHVADPSLDAVTAAYARALGAENVGGPVNVGFRRDRNGAWKAQEINLRNTGATYPRFLMGLDELYLIASAFVPHLAFPAVEMPSETRAGHVNRFFAARAIDDARVAEFERAHIWPAGPT